jgi:hypothetical protein
MGGLAHGVALYGDYSTLLAVFDADDEIGHAPH